MRSHVSRLEASVVTCVVRFLENDEWSHVVDRAERGQGSGYRPAHDDDFLAADCVLDRGAVDHGSFDLMLTFITAVRHPLNSSSHERVGKLARSA